MRYGILIAASCVAVGLAACSGIGTPPSGGPTPSEPANGGGAAGGGYDSARTAMQNVIAEITVIEGLVVDTAAQKQAARTRLAAARTQYNEALAALRSAVAGLAAGSQARAAAESYLRGITLADIPSRLDAEDLRAADTWADIEGPSDIAASGPPPNAAFERFPRAEDDGTVISASDRLSIRTKAVMHSAGKTVFSAGGTGVTDELPMRSLTIRSAGSAGKNGNWRLQGRDGTPDALGATDGILNYSVEITPVGLVYKAGGNAIYYDFQRRFNVGNSVAEWYGRGPDGVRGTTDDGLDDGPWDGCYTIADATLDCTNWIHDDIKINFGRPSDANGVNAFFWQTDIPLPDGVPANDPNLLKAVANHGLLPDPLNLGKYRLWISNYGVDRQLEYADGRPNPDDDKDLFLQYAAYGVFMYTDLLVHTRDTTRQQGFHFGYDTFANQAGLKTTDITAGNVVEATFRGATLAVQALQTAGDVDGDGDFDASDRNNFRQQANQNEIRGDIVLNARIGSGANKISGEISRVEVLGDDGVWVSYRAVMDAVAERNGTQRLVLTGKDFPERAGSGGYPADYADYAANINADGSYEGGVFLQEFNAAAEEWRSKTWEFDPYYSSYPSSNSIFGGTIYGPRDDDFENIETAGYWFLQGDRRRSAWGGIMGSFGAVRTD